MPFPLLLKKIGNSRRSVSSLLCSSCLIVKKRMGGSEMVTWSAVIWGEVVESLGFLQSVSDHGNLYTCLDKHANGRLSCVPEA